MPLAESIATRLRDAGHQVWFVGGCVRDELLGRPAKDIDIATSAQPDELLRLFPRAGQVGAHFGVLLVPEGSERVEVATFRSDDIYADGRHPSAVHFESNPREDALRRDFTINALFRDPFSGEVLDFSTGRQDLAAKLIRTVGDPERRFREDHLRLLRAVRFAAGLSFDIEPITWHAMQQLAPLIRTVSIERVRDELIRILTEGGARRGFELLEKSGLLREILPEAAGQIALLPGRPSLTLALGILLHRAENSREILSRLHFPGNVIEPVAALVENQSRFAEAPKMRESELKRFLRMEHFEEHLELQGITCPTSNCDFIRRAQQRFTPESLHPPTLVSGHDLIAAGFTPGPLLGQALREIEDAQLENRLATREEALDFARRFLRQ